MDALVVAALASIALNPVLFRLAESWFEHRRAGEPAEPAAAELDLERRPSVATREGALPVVVIAGYRGLGRRLAARAAGVPLAVVDADADEPQQDAAPDASFVYGDPARAEVLAAAGVRDARILVLADLSLPQKMQVCTNARRLNPRIAIIGAAANDAERAWLEESGARFVCDALDEQTEHLARAIRANL
jgi:CPA2 family monovalent cation:H+ antiporter-2